MFYFKDGIALVLKFKLFKSIYSIVITVLISKKITIILQVDDNHVIRYIPPEDFAKTTGMIFQNLFGVFPFFHFVG